MYFGKEAFVPAKNRTEAKELFRRSVERVEVETHSYCNRRCDYCPNVVGDRLGDNKRIPNDIWTLLVSNLREIDYASNIVFNSYNEPLADRSILQRISEVRSSLPHARTMIYSNGDYLTPEYLVELAAAGLDYLHISIHTRPGDKYSDVQALNHIAKLVKRIRATIKYQVLKSNDFLVATIPHQTIEIEVRAINYWRHGTDRGGLLDGIGSQVTRTQPCYFPFAHFNIGFEGTIVPCCHIRSDVEAHQQYRYGNLRDYGSIFEAYASRIATDWRRHLISFDAKRAPCNTCAVPFPNTDQKFLTNIRSAWERHVVFQSTEG